MGGKLRSLALVIVLVGAASPAVFAAGPIERGLATGENRDDVWTQRPVTGPEETWTGEMDVYDRVIVGPGQTLRVVDADITFHSGDVQRNPVESALDDHPVNAAGIHVLPGGQLNIANSTLTNDPNGPNEAPVDRVNHSFELAIEGQASIQESEIEYAIEVRVRGRAADVSIRDTRIGYSMTNGLLVYGTNHSVDRDPAEPDVVLEDVYIHDSYGKQAAWSGGIYLMSSNLRGKDVRVERAVGTGTVYLETTTTQAQNGDHSTVSFEDLVAIGGPPKGLSSGTGPFYLRHASSGTFPCDRCTFVSTESGGGKFAALSSVETGEQPDVEFRDLQILNTLLILFPGADRHVEVDGGTFTGEATEVIVRNEEVETPLTLRDVGIEAGGGDYNDIGVENKGDAMVDARVNWWGDESGPLNVNASDGSVPASNPDGQGTKLSGPIQFGDWTRNPPTSDRPVVGTVVDPAPPTPPGHTATVTFSLTNYGNQTERFPLEVIDASQASGVQLSTKQVNLTPGQSTTATATITVPSDAQPPEELEWGEYTEGVVEVPVLADGAQNHAAVLLSVPVG